MTSARVSNGWMVLQCTLKDYDMSLTNQMVSLQSSFLHLFFGGLAVRWVLGTSWIQSTILVLSFLFRRFQYLKVNNLITMLPFSSTISLRKLLLHQWLLITCYQIAKIVEKNSKFWLFLTFKKYQKIKSTNVWISLLLVIPLTI